MNRSKWKGPYINLNIFKNNSKNASLTVFRNSTITPKFLGLSVNVHNGKKYTNLIVTENMLGHKFGEFSFTRANFIFKKKYNKK